MSELRQDPTTREWVIVATERARRPDKFAKDAHIQESQPAYDPACPFCQGNESMAPLEVLRYPDEKGTGWLVRVVSNKFPALSPEGSTSRRLEDSFFRKMDGVGVHEVIIESPAHNECIAHMRDSQVERILHAYRARFNVLRQNPILKHITIFKNHGEAAGTSLSHPHSQLIATPIPSPEMRRKRETAAAYENDMGSCLYCDLLRIELAERKRIVEVSDDFVVFHPYASRSPFETWIVPRLHQPSFSRMSDDKIAPLASVLRKTLGSLYEALHNPDFNYVIHTAPTDEEDLYYDWHIRIIPRLTTIAGFEMGSGTYITTALPEQSAAFMRKIVTGSH